MQAAAILIPSGCTVVEGAKGDEAAAAAVGDCNLWADAATGVTLTMRNKCTVPSSETATVAPATTWSVSERARLG